MDATINNRMEVGVCPTCGKQFPQDVSVCPHDKAELIKQMPDPMIGTMLPRQFRITGKLGRGAMSVVYGGIYEPLDQPVAIKLLKSHLVSDQTTFKRFQQEAKTAGALEHPNIVGVLDFGVTDQGVPYLIMEHLRGDSLSDRLKRTIGLEIDSVIDIFLQAADALQYTHERGIIHRDVKPSNILIVTENGADVVKIVDFGIAKMQTLEGNRSAADLTATGEVFGTPLYVSPEQAMGRTLDSRADIYSLGCVMYEAIAGKPAFNAPTAFDVIRLQITAEPIPLDAARPDMQIPPSLLVAVERAMTKEPNDRYQTMAELIKDLRQARTEFKNNVFGRGARVQSGSVPVIPISASRVNTISQSLRTRAPSGTQQTLVSEAVPTSSSKLQVSLFIFVCVSGCLTGILILFCLDFKDKLEVAASPTQQMVVASENTPKEAAAQLLDPEAATLSRSALKSYDSGNYTAAENDVKAALKIAEKKRQKIAGAVLSTQLGSISIAKKNYQAAQAVLLKAIPILEAAGNEQKDNFATALNYLGIAYYYTKDAAKAEPVLQRAYDIDKELYGSMSAACAGVLTNQGRVSEMQGKFDRAERYYRDSLAISEKVYGRTDKRLASRVDNLASFLKRRHKNVEAATLERRARDIMDGK